MICKNCQSNKCFYCHMRVGDLKCIHKNCECKGNDLY